jgi:sentrin-specific protease 1
MGVRRRDVFAVRLSCLVRSFFSGLADLLAYSQLLREYVDLEHINKKSKPFDWTGWVDYCPRDTPQQENGYDCGVFTCQFLEAISRGLDSPFNFTQRSMAFLRRRMVLEIARTELLGGT